MTLEEANKIVQTWSRFVENVHGRLMLVFLPSIPESLLPFPKHVLDEAIKTMLDYRRNTENQEALKDLAFASAFLVMYIADEKALSSTTGSMNDPKWKDAILPAIKQFRKDWLKAQGEELSNYEP